MPVNAILLILFIAVCVLTLSVIKLYTELNWLKESHIKHEVLNSNIFYNLEERIYRMEEEKCSK